MQIDNQNLEQWAVKIQASIDTAKYMLGACGALFVVIGSLIVYIFRSFKEYTAERFEHLEIQFRDHCNNHPTRHKK